MQISRPSNRFEGSKIFILVLSNRFEGAKFFILVSSNQFEGEKHILLLRKFRQEIATDNPPKVPVSDNL